MLANSPKITPSSPHACKSMCEAKSKAEPNANQAAEINASASPVQEFYHQHDCVRVKLSVQVAAFDPQP